MVKETTFNENEVTYIHDHIGLHKISNPSKTEVAVSLHLYTPPHAANFGFNGKQNVLSRDVVAS